ncbi:uncharacterized protein F4812DRAFT_468547 [Daldinia caldariorum]|uniref:uncharacterized protein n=1 Tax=Daldinia caldariorum TaxID=326644 RepID=UPI002007A2C5|nr:uncharacterized protein F4812DRAFT_468547 [Daldinia caldariorum]KAI1463650.1 hypothetical protein F4812DRAFT_468547 [Daldinia caldariorum]
MKSKYVPGLWVLLTKGFNGGLTWKTLPIEVYDEAKKVSSMQCHFLLRHPHSFHLAKFFLKGLKSKNPTLICLALSHVYEFAAEKVEFCASMEPVEFFAHVKNSYAWSSHLTDNAFWAFTYKAFHARQIFLNTALKKGEGDPTKKPFALSLDRFREAFLDAYPLDPTLIHGKDDKICQENIELVEDILSTNKALHAKYFPPHLTHFEGQGDGTDKLLPVKKSEDCDEPSEPITCKYDGVYMSKIPDEELFFYDTECKAKHHDAFIDAVNKGAAGIKNKELAKGAGSVRKYDAFKRHGEQGNADDADESGPSNEGMAAPDNGVEASADNDMPDIKKLKIEDDEVAENMPEDGGIPNIENLRLVDEGEEEASSP